MMPYAVSTRWLVALLSAMLVFQAGAVAPAFVLAEEPSVPPIASPAPETPPTVAPSPMPTSAAPASPMPTVSPEPSAAPVPTVEPTPEALGPEVVDLRTADSQTFQQSDGSFVTHFFSGVVFFQPEGRTDFQPIDTSLDAVDLGDVKARVDGAPAGLSLSAADAIDGFLSLAGDGKTISFGLPTGALPGVADAQPTIKENGLFAEYTDFLPDGIDLRVFPRADGFKSFLVLPNRPLVNAFTFAIDAPGLSLTDEGDGTLAFHDATGAVVGRIPRPYMVDSSEIEGFGSGLYSEAVTMTVAGARGSYLLTLTVDQAYLDGAIYPVYVDPTTTNFPTGSTTANDTFAAERYPNSNFNSYQNPGGYYEMWHGYEPGYGTYDEVFIRFNELRETLGTVRIDGASLKFYPWWQYYHYQWRPSQVAPITQDWDAGTLKWSNRPSVGADIGEFDTKEEVWSDIELNSQVQTIVNSATAPNNGWKIYAANYGQGSWKRIVSRNNSTLKPYLAVTWSAFVPIPTYPNSQQTSSRALSWAHDPLAPPTTSWQVDVATDQNFNSILVSSSTQAGSAMSWTIPTGTTLNNGQTYWWRVRAKYGVNTSFSAWSTGAPLYFVTDLRRGEESYYTRAPFGLGGGWRMAVGVHNGELTLDRYLFEIPSYGPPQTLSMSYSSLNNSSAYLGTGWSSNLTQRLTFATGVVNWNRADGGAVRFTESGGTWMAPAGHYETLTFAGGEYTVTHKDQRKLVFEGTGAGRLKRITNRFGKSLTLVWNTNSATATDASGRVTNIVITGGLITQLTDSAGRTWSFAYTAGQLTSVTDPVSATTTLGYGPIGLTSVTRQRSRVSGAPETITWSVAYASGKVSGVTDPVNAIVANTFTYTASQTTVGLLKSYSPVVRNTSTYTLDTTGRVTSMLDAEGYTASYTYDASSNLTQLVLPIDTSPATNQTVSYTYDARGNVLSQTTQLTATVNVVTAMSYNATNDLLTRSDADNDASVKLVTRFTYDAAGHLTSVNVNCTSSGTAPPTVASTCTGAGTQDSSTNVITTYTYAASDQLETETNPLGVVTKQAYDAHGNKTQTVENFIPGQSGTADRNVTTVIDYNQQTTAGKAGLPTSVTDAAGNVTSYTYDSAGRPLSETLPGDSSIPSLTQSTSYDEFGNVLTETASWAGATRTTTHAYDKANRETVVTDPAGVPTTSTHDAEGNELTNSIAGVTISQQFDGLGRVTDQSLSGASRTNAYDAQGRLVATKDPLGTVTRTVFDANGRDIQTIVNCTEDAANPAPPLTSWWTCDGSTLDDGTWNVTTSKSYDARGNVVSETAPNGRVTTLVYDDADRLIQRVDNDVANPVSADEDISTFYAYDSLGRQVGARAPTVDRNTYTVSRFFYDDAGRVIKEIRNCTDSGTTAPGDPAWKSCSGSGASDADTNLVTEYGYDERGNRVWVQSRDPSATTSGSSAIVTTRYAFNDANHVCGVLENATVSLAVNPCADPGSGTATSNLWTSYSYDGIGNAVSMTDAKGQATSYAYDAADRMTKLTDALGNMTLWTYDALGRRDSESESGPQLPLPIAVQWTYDGAGRVLTRTADGQTLIYTYDDNGNRLTAADPATGTISAVYDRLNRPLTVMGSNDSGATTGYAYGVTSATRTDASGSYAVTLDTFNRQISLSDPIHGASPFAWTYRADGQPASMSAPNANVTSFGYDDAGNSSSKTTLGPGNVVRASYGWTRNRAGQVLTETSTIAGDSTNGTTTFTYDPLARLTGFTRLASTATYAWEAVLNRNLVQVDSNPAVTTNFNAANQPTSDSAGGGYTHDEEGRLTARPGQTLAWDDLGRLTAVRNSTTNAIMAAYTYDALDRLLVVEHPGVDRLRFRYVGLSTRVAQVVNDTNNTIIRSVAYDWAGNRLFDWTGSGADQRIYGTNGHHDVTWTESGTGAVTSSLRYDPWGNLAASNGTSLPDFRFQGSWFDSTTELSWIVTRWYAPSLGRFISEDSLLGDSATPSSRHLYAYAEGRPVTRWDPVGQAACEWTRPAHRELYQGTSSTCQTYRFANPSRMRGVFRYNLFIAKKDVSLLNLPLSGDGRGFDGDCLKSRMCMVINLEFNVATVRIRPTCKRSGVPRECVDAKPIGGFLNNNVAFHESAPSGVLSWQFDLYQSLYWGGPALNGSIRIAPRGFNNGTGFPKPGIWLSGDGFPSTELYYRDELQRNWVYTQRPEGGTDDLWPVVGDWSQQYAWP